MPVKRTFGWVQNPGDLKKLKSVIGIFELDSAANINLRENRLPLLLNYSLISSTDYEIFQEKLSRTEIEIEYSILKGKGAGKLGRKNALCTGIVQAIIDAQSTRTYTDKDRIAVTIKKPYTDDWTADGYLRWAVSCELLDYNNTTDTCKISELGRKLALAEDNSDDEKNALEQALLAYPPVIRILTLLKEYGEQTKFELGSRFGFVGESGFTSVPQEIFLYDYCHAPDKEKSEIRGNFEGDSDKYARGIASWLKQMGWIVNSNKTVTEEYHNETFSMTLQSYKITRDGEKALKKANGNSSNPKLPRVVMFEMLASNKTLDADYIRLQRAQILKVLSGNGKTLSQIQTQLKNREINLSESAIQDHLSGLKSVGINIIERAGNYRLADKVIKLEIPRQILRTETDMSELKDKVRDKLKTVNHKYLSLIDLAYSNASTKTKKNSDAREFEIQTAELFTKELNFSGMRLGDSNRPDIIISYETNGTIIDNKSYADGFNIDKHNADEMSRYINENSRRIPGVPPNEWWKNFDENVTNYTFLFVTSFLKGRFEEQLKYISRTQGGIKGAAIGVENLLYLAENLKSGKISHSDFYSKFNNSEIICNQ